MPIYEFACPKCRRIFSFLARRVDPDHRPACPKCRHKKMSRQISLFALTLNRSEPLAKGDRGTEEHPMPDLDNPVVARAMADMERDLAHLDENNPKQMAQIMRKMKNLMPAEALPKELETAIKRLEAGEDPEKIEADMGDVFGAMAGDSGGEGAYSRDGGLYDF